MNEEIRKNEISEAELENVSGGVFALKICPKCGGNMLTIDEVEAGKRLSFYKCVKCGYSEQ